MSTLMIRLLLALAVLVNALTSVQAADSFWGQDVTRGMVVDAEPSCHEVAILPSPESDGSGKSCCKDGLCHCLVMQMTGIDSVQALPVPAGPLPVTGSLAYRSPVSPLMLRPPIA